MLKRKRNDGGDLYGQYERDKTSVIRPAESTLLLNTGGISGTPASHGIAPLSKAISDLSQTAFDGTFSQNSFLSTNFQNNYVLLILSAEDTQARNGTSFQVYNYVFPIVIPPFVMSITNNHTSRAQTPELANKTACLNQLVYILNLFFSETSRYGWTNVVGYNNIKNPPRELIFNPIISNDPENVYLSWTHNGHQLILYSKVINATHNRYNITFNLIPPVNPMFIRSPSILSGHGWYGEGSEVFGLGLLNTSSSLYTPPQNVTANDIIYMLSLPHTQKVSQWLTVTKSCNLRKFIYFDRTAQMLASRYYTISSNISEDRTVQIPLTNNPKIQLLNLCGYWTSSLVLLNNYLDNTVGGDFSNMFTTNLHLYPTYSKQTLQFQINDEFGNSVTTGGQIPQSDLDYFLQRIAPFKDPVPPLWLPYNPFPILNPDGQPVIPYATLNKFYMQITFENPEQKTLPQLILTLPQAYFIHFFRLIGFL